MSGRSLHHRVDVIVVHFEVGLGESLSLGCSWGDVSRVSEHILGALLVVATREDTLFVLLLTLRDVALVWPGLITPLNHLFLLLLPLVNLQEGAFITFIIRCRSFSVVLFEFLWVAATDCCVSGRHDMNLFLFVEDWGGSLG